MHTTKLPAAHSRTFSARIVDREYGVIRSISQHAVTLRNTAAGILAEVDGQSVSLASAVRILRDASRVTVTAEELISEAAA